MVSKAQVSFQSEYLKARGIDPQFALDRGVNFAGIAEMKRLSYKPALPAILFKNIDPWGGRLWSPARLQEPQGKLKFIYPDKASADPYLVEGGVPWTVIGSKPRKFMTVISEGPTRALAGAQRNIPVIALGGKDSAFEPRTDPPKLRAVFYKIKWKGRKVYISFDSEISPNDPGVRKLAAALTALGAIVHIVPSMRVTKDGKSGIDDEFAACGHEGYLARCAAAPRWDATESTGSEPVFRVLHDVVEEKIEYIWEGRIARGSITIFSGDPGTAKSFLAITLAAQFSVSKVPFSKEKVKPLRTLYATMENSAEQVIKPRFRAAEGNDHHLILFDGVKDQSGAVTNFTLQDLAPLEKLVARQKIDLLVLDPLQSYLGANVDAYRSNETRPILDGLTRLAVKYNMGVLIIRHLIKMAGGGRAIHRGQGSIDFTGAARIELLVGHVLNQPNNRAIITIKNNLGVFADGIDFSIEGKDMDARLIWKGASNKTAGDLQEPDKSSSSTGIVRCVNFLQEQLGTGPKTHEELLAASGGEFTMDQLYRARKRLRIVDSRRETRGPATWALRKDTVN